MIESTVTSRGAATVAPETAKAQSCGALSPKGIKTAESRQAAPEGPFRAIAPESPAATPKQAIPRTLTGRNSRRVTGQPKTAKPRQKAVSGPDLRSFVEEASEATGKPMRQIVKEALECGVGQLAPGTLKGRAFAQEFIRRIIKVEISLVKENGQEFERFIDDPETRRECFQEMQEHRNRLAFLRAAAAQEEFDDMIGLARWMQTAMKEGGYADMMLGALCCIA